MSKKIGIVAAIVIILGAGVAYAVLNKSSNSTKPAKTEQSKTENNEGGVSGTIKSLLTGGKTVKCLVDYSTEESGGKGTVYVDGKKMRSDLTGIVEGKNVETHVIYDENYSYIWSSDETTGIKMKIDQEDIKDSEEFQNESVDLEKEARMECSPWVSNSSLFTPPSNIKFSNLTEMVEGLKPKTNTETNNSVCDQIPDAEAKAECVKALNQN